MRWPFHFGKAARAEGNAAPQPATPPQRRDWASLAPIQRAIGDPPLTAPSLEFGRSLAGSEEPALSLETLGHDSSPEGPLGLVTGIANPITTYASTAELVGRPPRRGEAAVSVQAASGELASANATEAGPANTQDEESGDLLTRVLPAVTVDAPSAPTPGGRLIEASRVELGPLRSAQRSPDTAVQAPSEAGTADVNQPPPGARLNLGLSRRHGLGAPIRAADAAAAQRLYEAPASAVGSGQSEVQRSPAETPVAAEQEPSAPPQVSGLSLQRAADEDRSRVLDPEAGLAPLPPVRRQGGRAHSDGPDSITAAEPTVPDVGSAIREPQADASLAMGIAQALGAAPVSIQRLVGSEPLRKSVGQSRIAPESYERTPTVPLTSLRQPITSVRPLAAFGDMPQPAIQRSPILALNPAAGPAGASTPHGFRSPEPSPLVWNVQRLAPGESPGSVPIGDGPAAGDSPSTGTPMMAAAPAMAPTSGAAPGPGGAAEGAPHPGEATPAGGGGTAPGAPGAGAASMPHGEKELHELAQALFHPLMSLFRREVLTERERAGFVTDLR